MLSKQELENHKSALIDPFGQEKMVIIAGPCSIESLAMANEIAHALSDMGVKYMRGGAWKPRTKPGGFMGHGMLAAEWIAEAAKTYELTPMIEVAEEFHIDCAMRNGIDHVWLGARTVSNPFSIADLVRYIPQHTTVLVKNPISADVDLWEGAVLRLLVRGIKKIGIIHRGFTNSGGELRNSPGWGTLAEMMTRFPGIRVISDPSHMTGDSELVKKYALISKAVGTGGVMIETHNDPAHALTDSSQQVLPFHLKEIIAELNSATALQGKAADIKYIRKTIDQIDRDIYDLLAERLQLSHEIAEHKLLNGLSIVDAERWNNIIKELCAYESSVGVRLSNDFIRSVFTRIHDESVTIQASHVK